MLSAAAVSFQIRAKREGIQHLPTRLKSVPYLRWSSSRLSLWSSWKTRNSWKRKELSNSTPHPRFPICNSWWDSRTLAHPLCEGKSQTHSGIQHSLIFSTLLTFWVLESFSEKVWLSLSAVLTPPADSAKPQWVGFLGRLREEQKEKELGRKVGMHRRLNL